MPFGIAWPAPGPPEPGALVTLHLPLASTVATAKGEVRVWGVPRVLVVMLAEMEAPGWPVPPMST